MNCTACGGDNRDGARFCRHCGLAMQPPAAGQEPTSPGGEASADQPPASPGGEASADQPPAPPGGEALAGQAPAPPGGEALADQAPAPPGGEASADQPPAPPGGEASADRAPAAPGVEPSAAAPPSESKPCAPCLEAVPPGTVLDGRYLVMEALDQQPAHIRYAARDLCRCWQCGFDANAPDDAFCAQCGASLAGRRAIVPLLQVLDAQVEAPEGEELVARFSEDDAPFLVLRARPVGAPEPKAEPLAGMRLLVGQATHSGQVRPLNEDSLLVLRLAGSSLRTTPGESQGGPLLLGLFAVADGMGGHEGGEVASKLALHVFAGEVLRTILLPAVEGRDLPAGSPSGLLARAVEAANDAVFLARQKRGNDMGTTLTAALLFDARVFLAHIGDCRALHWSPAGLEQLTADHSLIASLVAAGRAAPDEVYTSPQRSVVLRSIGDRPTVQVDTAELSLSSGERLILCSDGLWEMLRNEGIADVLMQEPDPQAAADLLVARANAAGGDDNITVVVVQVA